MRMRCQICQLGLRKTHSGRWCLAAVFPVVLVALAGCIRQPDGDGSLLPPAPTSSAPPFRATSAPPPPRTLPPQPTLTRSPSPSAFAESYVVACNGRPSAEQVITVTRRQPHLIPAGATVTVTTGPLCAGLWQYTILTITDREPLQVMTKGAPTSLTFVTAGTDVCSVEVLAGAPLALQRTANCRALG
jgi:hypothetical protein